MRPNAPSFSPHSKPTPSRHGQGMEWSLVEHANGGSGSIPSPSPTQSKIKESGSARYLLMHEAVKQLLSDFEELKLHCIQLENQNLQLTGRFNAHDAALQSLVTPGEHVSKSNLSGYASSESSHGSSMDVRKQQDAAFSLATSRSIQEHAVAIQDQSSTLDDLQRRVRFLETGRVNFDVNDVDHKNNVDHKNDVHFHEPAKVSSDLNAYLREQLDSMSGKINVSTRRIDDLEEKLSVAKALRTAEALGGAQTGQGSSIVSQMMAFLKNEVDKMKRMRAYEETIDNTSTKDELYRIFKQLTAEMFRDQHANDFLRLYQANDDQLFNLRTRVLRRIALFDTTNEALEEARAAEVEF